MLILMRRQKESIIFNNNIKVTVTKLSNNTVTIRVIDGEKRRHFSGEVDAQFSILDGVVIKILGINGSQIRLGIDAPRDMVIYREEVLGKIKREKQGE